MPGINTEEVPGYVNLHYSETYTYNCMEGYITFDEVCATCLINGSLSIPPPTCIGTEVKLFIYVFFYLVVCFSLQETANLLPLF